MIRLDAGAIGERARQFIAHFQPLVAKDVIFRIAEGFSVIGGGSTPDQQLPTHLISILSPRHSSAALEERLRKPASATPVIARIENKQLILDLRTVLPAEESELVSALASALS
jgi:L-seryl-tRNA(Ser) seleniumtransferase